MTSPSRETRAKIGSIGWPRSARSRLALPIVALALLAALVAAAVVLIDRGSGSGNASGGNLPAGIAPWPAQTANPDNLTLQLSQTTVSPGQIITRTIEGGGADANIASSAAMMLDAKINGEWRTLFFLELAPEDPRDTVATADVAIPAIALPPTALRLRIPDLPPGTYRLRQDASSKSGPTSLYATITIEER